MSKAQFLAMFQAMYRVGNRADSDNPDREPWTQVDMAGKACCRPLDIMARELVKCGVLTEEERQTLYDTL